MKKLASILISFAIAFGLMVPTMAFADDGIGNVAIDYNGQRINLKPQVDEAAHSLMIKFQVQTDVAKYQNYVHTGFSLSSEARSARIAQSSVAGSTVTAVISNGESPLQFNDNTLFLGTLTVTVNAKLGAGDSTAARIVVTQMDTTDETFGAPSMHAMDTRDNTGELVSIESRAVPVTLASSAYTGTEVPTAESPGSGDMPQQPSYYNPGNVAVGIGQLAEGVFIADSDKSALQSVGSDLIQKVKDQLDAMLAGNGEYPGLTSEQLQKIAQIVEAAGGNLDDIEIAVTPSAVEIGSDEAKDAIALMDKKFSGATVLSVYDLSVSIEVSYQGDTTGPLDVTELIEPINFTVGVPEGSLASMNAAVGYVHDGQAYAIDKGVKPSLQSNTVQFPAMKFSTYAVYGKEKTATPTAGPVGSLIQTNDSNPLLMIGFGGLAVIACVAAYLTIRRRKAQAQAKA